MYPTTHGKNIQYKFAARGQPMIQQWMIPTNHVHTISLQNINSEHCIAVTTVLINLYKLIEQSGFTITQVLLAKTRSCKY